jgi:hypothetical protein
VSGQIFDDFPLPQKSRERHHREAVG